MAASTVGVKLVKACLQRGGFTLLRAYKRTKMADSLILFEVLSSFCVVKS